MQCTKRIAGLAAATVLTITGCETIPEIEAPLPVPRSAAVPAPFPGASSSYHTVRRGDTLWRIARAYGLTSHQLAAANRLSGASQLRVGQRLFIPLPSETRQFLWPVRGRVGRTADGLQIVAQTGSLVRASRSGRVAVATRNLSGWGRTIILDHVDGYLTVYAGLAQILVAPGADVRQGLPIGSVGPSAMYFQIRNGTTPRNAASLLPRE